MSARVVLARAAVQVLADGVAARVLHIKGETTDPQLGGPQQPGTDVDALVHPDDIPRMDRALREHGWRVYSSFTFGSPFEHAQTYAHETWGYFDLHRRFPGIGLPDRPAFEMLWPTRIHRDDAGIRYATPGVDAQAIVQVLNAVRNGRPTPAFWTDADEEQKTRRLALVRELHAEVAVAAALGELESMKDHREYLLWRFTVQGGPRVVEWWARVVAQPNWRAAVRVAAQAPRVNTDQLTHRLGHEPSRGEIAREFGARLVRGAREGLGLVRRSRS